jgi:hypothetical protein
MTAATHALLAPSSASRTTAHQLSALLIDDACRGLLPERWEDITPKFVDGVDSSVPEFVVGKDMYRAAHGYAWEVFKVLRTLKVFGGKHMGIEDRLEIPSISAHP